jgi:hypothetical protein
MLSTLLLLMVPETDSDCLTWTVQCALRTSAGQRDVNRPQPGRPKGLRWQAEETTGGNVR